MIHHYVFFYSQHPYSPHHSYISHSPTAWTVAEQAYANKKKKAEAEANAQLAAQDAADNEKESVPPPPPGSNGGEENMHVVKDVPPLPTHNSENPPPVVNKRKDQKAPSAAALADYYVRRPLAPSNIRRDESQAKPAPAPRRGYADYRHIQSRYAQYNQPKPKVVEPVHRRGYYAVNGQGQQARQHYQHRMW
jgi:hypothetical protein